MKCRMAYREQRFVYGSYLEVNIYPVFQTVAKTGRRTVRKPTREVQQRLNLLNRAKEVNRVICANFTSGDLYLTLTCKGEQPTEERFRRDLDNFLGKYARALAKRGADKPKWVKTIEVGSRSGRIHAHLVITGGIAPHEIQAMWGRGYIDCKPLMFDKDGVLGLAKYFVKQTRNESGDGHRRKSWSCSRNCIRPVPKTNDYRYSKRKAAEIARERENARLLEKLYPDYLFSACEPFYNDENGLYYLHMRFVRKGARLDL